MYYNVPPQPRRDPTANKTPEQVVESAYAQAEEFLDAGNTLAAVKERLVKTGYSGELAESIVKDLGEPERPHDRRRRISELTATNSADASEALRVARLEKQRTKGHISILFGGLLVFLGLGTVVFGLVGNQPQRFLSGVVSIVIGAVGFFYGLQKASAK